MGNDKSPWTKIDRQLEGEAITVGDRTIHPVGRLKGWQIRAGDGTGAFFGLGARLEPLEVVVREDDDEVRISITDPLQEPLRGILFAGIAVSAICLFIMLLATLAATRQSKS